MKLLNDIIFVLCAIKAYLASSSPCERWLSGGEITSLLTKKPCREVKTAGILFLWREAVWPRPKESGSVSLPCVFFYFGGVCNRCKRQCMVSPICLSVLIIHIRAAISYLCLFGCTCYLVCLAILDQVSPDTELLSEHQVISGSPLI